MYIRPIIILILRSTALNLEFLIGLMMFIGWVLMLICAPSLKLKYVQYCQMA